MAEWKDNPPFSSEEEEAEWWPKQEDKIADAFEKAAKEGTLRRRTSGVVETAEEFFARRSVNADPRRLMEILKHAPRTKPMPGDELPDTRE